MTFTGSGLSSFRWDNAFVAGTVAFAASISGIIWASIGDFVGAVGISVGAAGAGTGDSGAHKGGGTFVAVAKLLRKAAGASGSLSLAIRGLPRKAALPARTGRRHAPLP